MNEIHLGFETKTAKKVSITPSHLIVTGITQLSGKTTTLEALIKRSKYKAIVFKTKIGETGFSEGTIIPPHFKERSDWQYVQSLLEATLKERLKFERAWIIRACKNANSLLEVKNHIDNFLVQEKLGQLNRNIYETLQAYFELVLPQLQIASFSRTLDIQDGINVMDLERFRGEIQSLVIRSVLEQILNHHKNTIIVIPEAWKFLPQTRGNPCKVVAEEFIRQGATNKNFLWIDSQDMTGVDKTPLKQVSTWILGLQTEKNEVVRTLDQVPLSRKQRPKPNQIMTLQLGHFYLCTPKFTKLIYVQPAWLDEDIAKEVARGKRKVETLKKPSRIAPFGIQQAVSVQSPATENINSKFQQELIQLRHDFFDKITEQSHQIQTLAGQISDLQLQKQSVNTDEVVSLVLQKMPSQAGASTNEETIIKKVLARVPKAAGSVTYEVSPLEKIQKGFLESAKNKIISDVEPLDEEQKKILKFVETQQRGCKQSPILSKCLYLSATSGGTRSRISSKCKEMANLGLVRMDKNATVYPNLKERIKELLGTHNASEQEIEQVYNHILANGSISRQ